MTKQRPQASTLKVGTHRQGYVVKTRRAGQSAKRIKYWAKDTKKPKSVKQACKAQRTKRKGAKGKSVLRGGSHEQAMVYLSDILKEDSAVHKKFADELSKSPDLFEAILQQAEAMLKAFNKKNIGRVLQSEEAMSSMHRQETEILTDIDQQAHAIVTAHVAFRSREYKRRVTMSSRDIRAKNFTMKVDLEQDKLWESVQAHTFQFVKSVQVGQNSVKCDSNETFVEAGKRLGIPMGANTAFIQIYAKVTG
jgi:hypothetical protein